MTQRTCHFLIGRLYQGTIRFNIVIGAVKDEVSQDDLDNACKNANVFPVI